MPEHEVWLTALFNDYLAGLANAILGVFNVAAENPMRPWQNWIVMELLVAAILIVVVAILRTGLSVDNPGKLQHVFETVYGFLKDQAAEVGIQHGEKYVGYFGTVFIMILSMNLIGIIPSFESPTMSAVVPAGMAVCTFLYYNTMGIRAMGPLKYLGHFAGPVWWLAWLLFPLEIIGNLARLLSLTVRLYGNMYAGEQVTNVFLSLTYVVVPVIFMGLHVFVSILQAYVFTLLSMIYVSTVTSHEH